MHTNIAQILENSVPSTAIIASVAMMLTAGFFMTRLTKPAKLPNVTAYILAGILLGPNCFKMVPRQIIDGMGFLADIALAFIAFG
ncbi:MAG: cation:proton antiporter, partial [Firmicutes bacterium]|nr:cation:proton antiporter [Bacillota bacterium]